MIIYLHDLSMGKHLYSLQPQEAEGAIYPSQILTTGVEKLYILKVGEPLN